jgi:hypothetical protein
MTKENNNKLLKAQNDLGKNLKPFVNKIINKNKDLRKDRDSIIKFVYDYIQILKIEDKDTDNHSFSKLSRTVFDSVNLDMTEHHNTYFRKFANVCVQGALLFHWQDLKILDNKGNNTVIKNLQFAKKDSVNWEINKYKVVKKDNKKTAWRMQHPIDKGQLVAPHNLLIPFFMNGSEKIVNDKTTLLTVDNRDITNLYNSFRDISARELDEQEQVDDSLEHPQMTSLISAIKVLSELFKDATMDKNFVASCFVDKNFISAYDELEQQQLNLKKCNSSNVVDTGKGGKDDYWSNQKKLVGKTKLTELKKTMENK